MENYILLALAILILALFGVMVGSVIISIKREYPIAYNVSKQGCLFRFDCYKDCKIYSIYTNYDISNIRSVYETLSGEIVIKTYNGKQYKVNLLTNSITEKKK